jgi:hypothetical protein
MRVTKRADGALGREGDHPTFNFLALRKSELIRVCQPSPVLRYAASTSASSLSFTACFGFSNGGRPRRIILSPCRISARSKNLSVTAGASSGSTHAAAPDFFFLGMTVPHRNNVTSFVTLRPDHHHQPTIETTRRDETSLAVIKPIVSDHRSAPSKHLAGPNPDRDA